MKSIILIVPVALALAACAAMKPSAEEHAAHHPGGKPSPALRADEHMRSMKEMQQKMAAARTPQERQALMAEHMKAMQGGMSMMCEMGQQDQGGMMNRCMEMRDMTMQMMKQREDAAAPVK